MSYIWIHACVTREWVSCKRTLIPDKVKKFYGKRNLVRLLQRFRATWSYYVKSLKLYTQLSLLRLPLFLFSRNHPKRILLTLFSKTIVSLVETLCTRRLCIAKKSGDRAWKKRNHVDGSWETCFLNWNHYNFKIITSFPSRGKKNGSLSQPGMKSQRPKRENERVSWRDDCDRKMVKNEGRRSMVDEQNSTFRRVKDEYLSKEHSAV